MSDFHTLLKHLVEVWDRDFPNNEPLTEDAELELLVDFHHVIRRAREHLAADPDRRG